MGNLHSTLLGSILLLWVVFTFLFIFYLYYGSNFHFIFYLIEIIGKWRVSEVGILITFEFNSVMLFL